VLEGNHTRLECVITGYPEPEVHCSSSCSSCCCASSRPVLCNPLAWTVPVILAFSGLWPRTHRIGRPLARADPNLMICFDQQPKIAFLLVLPDVAYSTLAHLLPTSTVLYCLHCRLPTGKHDQTSDNVGHTTDCRPAWNKCRLVPLSGVCKLISFFNTH